MLIVRNPTKRAYSHFQMVCTRESGKMNKYRVDLRKTRKIMERRKERHIKVMGLFRKDRRGKKMPHCNAVDFDNFVRAEGPNATTLGGIFQTGMYADDLERWFKVFPKHQFLVLFNEHFVANATDMFRDIQTYLGIPFYDYSAHTYVNEIGYTLLEGTTSKVKSKAKYAPSSPLFLPLFPALPSFPRSLQNFML